LAKGLQNKYKVMIMKKTMIASAVFVSVLLSAISGFALTPDQVIKLKKAGVSDETIQMMIKQEKAGKKSPDTMGVKETRDNDGNTVINYSTGESTTADADAEEARKAEKAWEMLRNIIIDNRSKK
jgi:hypothetical protein